MSLLYITEKVSDLNTTIRQVAEESGISYNVCNYKDYRSINFEKNTYSVIILKYEEYKSHIDDVIWTFSNIKDGIVTIIMMYDQIDFSEKEHYYNLGVASIIKVNQYLESSLSAFFLSAKEEIVTINTLRTMQVAVVDDSRFSLELIRSYFEKIEVKSVSYFQSPEAMIDKIDHFDFFIIDFVMPQYTGDELIQKIRESNKDCIIILITTYGTAIPHGMHIGANDFLYKPFSFKMFISRVSASIYYKKLENLKQENEKELLRISITDKLTGLYNRAYFIEKLNQVMLENKRYGKQIALVLLDIDHFKLVNDTYGHLMGDKVLIELGQILKENVRETDCLARWGGEEFAIILLNTSLESAASIAEKIRKKIEVASIENYVKISASFGITELLDSDDSESIFKRVDNSLYLAKLTGRNKVVSNEEIYIYKSGLPVNIEWGPFFRSGHPSVDSDHNNLISLSNNLIQNCFIENNEEKLFVLFKEITEHIIDHFKNEEEVLEVYNYDRLEEHKVIHQNLINQTLKANEKMSNGLLKPLDLAKFVIQEVVIGHIIKSDFDFYDLFSTE